MGLRVHAVRGGDEDKVDAILANVRGHGHHDAEAPKGETPPAEAPKPETGSQEARHPVSPTSF